uniref:Uncharacterized protein n=2 Tax=Anguilla anguilla TaxID=7936 RepID=A0A0E9PLL9_ANGAN
MEEIWEDNSKANIRKFQCLQEFQVLWGFFLIYNDCFIFHLLTSGSPKKHFP